MASGITMLKILHFSDVLRGALCGRFFGRFGEVRYKWLVAISSVYSTLLCYRLHVVCFWIAAIIFVGLQLAQTLIDNSCLTASRGCRSFIGWSLHR